MLILVHSAPRSLLRDHGRDPNLGVLASPRCVYGDDITEWPWAADNDAYSDWDADRFRKMIDRIRGRHGCLFVTAPDVVGDHNSTLWRFYHWLPELAGLPAGFVGQDGCTASQVPWDKIACFFIGGTSEWKMGEAARVLAVEAKRQGKWLHMGRVNTRQRIVYAKAIGCDSVDGTAFSMYRQTHLPWALRYAAAEPQLMLAALSAGARTEGDAAEHSAAGAGETT